MICLKAIRTFSKEKIRHNIPNIALHDFGYFNLGVLAQGLQQNLYMAFDNAKIGPSQLRGCQCFFCNGNFGHIQVGVGKSCGVSTSRHQLFRKKSACISSIGVIEEGQLENIESPITFSQT